MVKDFYPIHKTNNYSSTALACIKMIADYYEMNNIPTKVVSDLDSTTSHLEISNALERIGFKTRIVNLNQVELCKNLSLPIIVELIESQHFVVVYEITKRQVFFGDPLFGLRKLKLRDFWAMCSKFHSPNIIKTILLEHAGQNISDKPEDNLDGGRRLLFDSLKRHKKLLGYLAIILLVTSIIQLFFPFLTQSLVDVGIQNKDLSFIYLILFAQIFLFIGKLMADLMRGWIQLHLSTRINVTLVSDFFVKIMRLPISYFDKTEPGDLMQRINDHKRIEQFLTSVVLNVIFSLFTILVFASVLLLYDIRIFGLFLLGTCLYLVWGLVFLRKRKKLDYNRFGAMREEQNKVLEIIYGMQDIKLNNSEKKLRWDWENKQAKLFKVAIKNLKLTQTQAIGSSFLNEFKNIFISAFSATLVVQGELTLGAMLSIQYIIGALNGPIDQLIRFIYSAQDAKIAFDRRSEILDIKPESYQKGVLPSAPADSDIQIENVSFKYPQSDKNVLSNINLKIKARKVTAIVGVSGSGKSTLMKLLLSFYSPTKGEIHVGDVSLDSIPPSDWRELCGVVLPNGYVFDDSVAMNIALGSDTIDEKRLMNASKAANVHEFIQKMDEGYNTRLGIRGAGISSGQKQRILIARAIYREPSFLFLDEATSSLDTNNESDIMSNLSKFMDGRTAVIIAHRLSTVRHADNIVVMEGGKIVESGNHEELIEMKGCYYGLVQNQLEIG